MKAAALEIIDPHMHMWDLGRHHYDWLQDTPLPNNPAGDMTPIAYRSYGVADYLADTAGWNVVGTVHVECCLAPADQPAETRWLQSLADLGPYPLGIVAGAQLHRPDVEGLLECHAASRSVRGVRHIVGWHADPLKTYTEQDLLEDPDWWHGFALLRKYDLSFDLLLYPTQMPRAALLAARNPDTRLIINHTGMPTDRDPAGVDRWRTGMRLLAERPNVAVKISGLAMCDRAWTVDSFRPFVLETIDLFGVERCMFASNFPVESVHGAFSRHYGAFDQITGDFSEAERQRLFAGGARAIYRLPTAI